MSIPAECMVSLQWMALLALEAAIAVFVAGVVQRSTRSALRQRTVWRGAVLAVLLVLLAEVSGLSRDLGVWARGAATPSARASVTTPPQGESPSQTTDAQITSEFRQRVAGRLAHNRRSVPGEELRQQGALLPIRAQQLLPRNVSTGAEAAVEPYLQGHSMPWPELVWVIGIGAVLGPIGLARLFFRVFQRRGRAVTDGALTRRVALLRTKMGLRRAVRIFESDRLATPVAFGLIAPAIGLPKDFASRYSIAQQDVMLAHELAHVAAHDLVWQALADIVTAFLWWHPLIWWTRTQLRSASETAADEASLLLTDGPGVLAECLLQLASGKGQPSSGGWVGMTGDGFRSQLGRRIQRLINLPPRAWCPMTRSEAWAGTIVLPTALMAAAVLGTAWMGPPVLSKGEKMQSMIHTWKRSVATLALLATFGADQGDAQTSLPAAAPTATPTQATPSVEQPPFKEPLPAPGQPGIRVSTLINDAKLLQELGNLEAAEAKLKEALQLAPQSQKAAQALTAIQQARSQTVRPNLELPPPSTPVAANAPTTEPTGPSYRMDPRLAARYGLLPAPTRNPAANASGQTPAVRNAAAADSAPADNGGTMDPALATRYGIMVPASPGRPNRAKQQIESKLSEIVLSDVAYEGLPLSEVVRDLNEIARKRDKDRRGINFLISNVPEGPMPSGGIDPTTGQPLPGPSVVDLQSVAVRLHLRDVRMKDVLDAMVKISESPIKYSVEDYGVVISPGAGPTIRFGGFNGVPLSEPLPLQVRTFKVDTNTFLAGLESAFGIAVSHQVKKELLDDLSVPSQAGGAVAGGPGPVTDQTKAHTALAEVEQAWKGPGPVPGPPLQQALRQLLQQLGINMEAPNKAVFYNTLTGIVMVRATVEDLELVQAAIETLGGRALHAGLTGLENVNLPAN